MNTIDVRELIGQPGAIREVATDEPLSVEAAAGLAKVTPGSLIHAELVLESVIEGIFLAGTIRGDLTLTCSRCLRVFEQTFAVRVEEMFVSEPDEDEYTLDLEGHLDIEPMVRDAVVLSLPFAPLHDPRCKGLCERCGEDRNLGECSCEEQAVDPRWDALRYIDLEMQDADDR